MKKWLAIVIVLASLAIGFAGGYHIHTAEPVIEYHQDTLLIRDTITQIKPDPVISYIHDSIRVEVVVHKVDTEYVYLPHEYKRYKNDNYDLTISGYQPVLESISVYPEKHFVTTVVTEPAKAKRWGLGCQLGYGVSKDGLTPYIGIGLSYNLISF